MNAQGVIDDISQRIRSKLSRARMNQQFKLLIDVTVKIEGEKPIILHETLANKRKFVSREDDIYEIVKRRINTMIGSVSGKYVSGEYIPTSKITIMNVDYELKTN